MPPAGRGVRFDHVPRAVFDELRRASAGGKAVQLMPSPKIKEHGFALRAEPSALDRPVSAVLHAWVDEAIGAS